MKRRGMGWLGIVFVLVWGLPVLACGGSTPATATPTKTPVLTYTPTPVPLVANTATPMPTETPLPTPTPVAAWVIPVNQTIDRAGVVITLVDVTFWPGSALEGEDLRRHDAFANAQVVGRLQVVIENTRDEKATVHAAQGTVVVGSEQVNLASTLFISDDLGGEMFPGVRKHGDAIFGLNNVSYEVLHGLTLIYEVTSPSGDGSFRPLAEEDYLFQVVIP